MSISQILAGKSSYRRPTGSGSLILGNQHLLNAKSSGRAVGQTPVHRPACPQGSKFYLKGMLRMKLQRRLGAGAFCETLDLLRFDPSRDQPGVGAMSHHTVRPPTNSVPTDQTTPSLGKPNQQHVRQCITNDRHAKQRPERQSTSQITSPARSLQRIVKLELTTARWIGLEINRMLRHMLSGQTLFARIHDH